jgi:hypothetical protein
MPRLRPGPDYTLPLFRHPSNIHHFRHFTFHILVPALYLHLRSWMKENGGVVLKIVKLIFVFCHVPPSRMCASHAHHEPLRRTLQSATCPGPLHMTHSSLYLQKSPPVTHHCHTQRAATSTTCLTQGNNARALQAVVSQQPGLHRAIWNDELACACRRHLFFVGTLGPTGSWFGSDFPLYQSGIAHRSRRAIPR